jgi:DNA repair exonuclease SbcCD ATPase subunit
MNYEPPPDETGEECPYCGRPFPTEEILTLHTGHAHREALSDAESERLRDVAQEEADELRLFKLRALAVLVLLYFGFLLVYAVVTA